MLIGSIVVISKKTSFRSLDWPEEPIPSEMITIDIGGCVKKEGAVQLQQGSTVRTALRKAGLKPLSDLSKLNLDQVLETSGPLFVPSLDCIVVKVQGCVEENVSLTLPVGSRICDLQSRLALSPNADLAFFKRRRTLKNNELIEVPSRKGCRGASD
jgi:hypothetical protein